MNIKPVQHSSGNWAIVCPPGFEGATTRKFRYFDTKSAAGDFAKVVNNWRHAQKAPKFDGAIQIQETDTAMVAFLRGVGILNVGQLSEVITHWQRTQAVSKLSLLDGVQAFLTYYVATKAPEEATLRDVAGKLKNFSADLPGLQCHEITRKDVIDYLGDIDNHATRNQWLKKLRLFFKWATNEQVVGVNPVENIDWAKVDTKDSVEIFTAADVRKLLQTSDTDHKELLPWLALQFFGFMRSAEAEKLDWSAIDFEAGVITVSAQISKTNRRRVITISDQLRAWLLPYRKESGPVVTGLNGNVAKLFAAAGVTRLHNAARHTCCTVAAAALGETVGLTRICQQAGHSPSVARKHYWEAMTPEVAKAYGEIRR